MQLLATTENVIVLTSPDTGEPVAMIRKNGHIQWFTLKETTLTDYERLLEVTSPSN